MILSLKSFLAFWISSSSFSGIDFFDSFHKELWHSTQHHIANTRIEIDGDTARTESYCFLAAKKLETLELVIIGGRYIRRLEKRDGEWRIALRRLVMDFRSLADSSVFEESDGYPKGAQDPTDISYARPLELPAELLARLRPDGPGSSEGPAARRSAGTLP